MPGIYIISHQPFLSIIPIYKNPLHKREEGFIVPEADTKPRKNRKSKECKSTKNQCFSEWLFSLVFKKGVLFCSISTLFSTPYEKNVYFCATKRNKKKYS